jgi:hypothetical protein
MARRLGAASQMGHAEGLKKPEMLDNIVGNSL